jgi:hypothetical protein
MERPVTINAANHTFDRASTIYLYAVGDSWQGHLTQQNALVESPAPDAWNRSKTLVARDRPCTKMSKAQIPSS